MWNSYILGELARDIMRSAHADAERRRQAATASERATAAPGRAGCCKESGRDAGHEAAPGCARRVSPAST